jgi:hypothetical protein
MVNKKFSSLLEISKHYESLEAAIYHQCANATTRKMLKNRHKKRQQRRHSVKHYSEKIIGTTTSK